MLAIYALADSRSDDAVRRLRACLMDPNEKNQLKAACLLTEFDDHSGAKIIKDSLRRLRASDDQLRFLEAGLVIASLEQITGKSFGRVPPSPLWLIDSRRIVGAERQYDEVLASWDKFCNP